jgi:uncharacterized protein (DUF433 family)
MNAQPSVTPFGLGLYPLPDAARLAQLDTRTARRWAEGYDFRHHGEKRHSPGIMGLALAPIGGMRDLTFPEMLTLRLVKGFRGAGLSLRTIKRVAEAAAQQLGTPTPFVTRRFRTDGRKVFMELQHAEPANDEPGLPKRERQLIEVLTGQGAFANVVEPSLFRNVEWEADIAARWWPLGQTRAVVLDPTTMFGAPRIARTRVPTAAVAAAVAAEGGGASAVQAVAEWHGLTADQVHDAVEFETEWLKRAA